jgi:hypothetical protein
MRKLPRIELDVSAGHAFPPGKPPTFTIPETGDVWTIEPATDLYVIDRDIKDVICALDKVIVDTANRRICLPARFFGCDLGDALLIAWMAEATTKGRGK